MRGLLTKKQKRAIDLLVKGWKHSAVSRILKINSVTLWRWKKSKNFMELLEQENKAQHQTIEEKLGTVFDKAKDIVMEAMEKRRPKISGYVKIALDILKIYKPAFDLMPKKQNDQPKQTTAQDISALLEARFGGDDHVYTSQEFEQEILGLNKPDNRQVDIDYQI